MKKVVAFIGSPRKNGNTASLVLEAVRGAEAAGAQASVHYLNSMNIKPCQSCFYCRSEDTCIIEDEMKAVYPELQKADAVIIGSPVYMFQVAAQTKILFDRMFPLMDAQFRPRFGIKKTLLVYSQGNPDAAAFQTAFDTNREILKVMGLQLSETLVCTGANNPRRAADDKTLLEKAFAAGKKLIR